jgi:hypothetical protein
VITSVTADSITFIEPNKGADGGLVTETFDQFRQSWNPAGGTGYLVMFRDKAVASKTISDETAKRIRGAFFGIDLIFWFTVASIALTVASVAVSYISPALGKILGYAAMVAGIVAIAASVVNFVVAGFQTMLTAVSNFNNLGLLQSIQQGFSMLGNAIWSGVSHIGDWIRGGFNFVKGVFTGGFGGLSAGITSMKQFAVDGIQLLKNPAGGLIRQNLTFAQIVGRSMIAAAINLPLSKGLEGLGIDSTMARLAGAFVSGGLVGLGGGAAGFFSSGVQMYLLQGVSEIGMHLNLPPPITQAVSLAVTSSLASYFDPSFNLKTYLPQIFKDFSKQLTMGGIDLIGRSMGMKPWLTGLIKIPAAAAVGGIVDTLMHPSTGVSSLWQTIKNAVLSPQTVGGLVSVGANIALDAMGIPQIAMDLVRGFLSGLGQTDAGKAIFEKIGAGINKFTGWITTGIGAVIDFGAKALGTLGQITKEGFQSAMRFFSRFFSQETQENIYKEETQIVGGKLVINGDEWKYYVGDSVITYNRQTDVIFDNSGVGSARLEGLGGDSTGKFTFKNISVEEVMAAGATLKQTYENGGLKEWRYQGAKGETMTVSAPTDVADQGQWISRSGQLENGKVVINIPGSDPEPNSGHDPLTTPAWYDWSVLTIQNKDGKIVRADTEYRFGQGAQSGGAGSTKPLYVLTNGINNDNYFGGAPLYLYALHDDLIVKSDGQIGVDDVAVAKDYPPLQLLGIGIVQYLLAVATGGTIQLSTINQAHDIITLLQEMVDPTAEGAVTSEIRVGLNAFFFRYGQVNRSRSRIGVGYSGGFGPLEEVLIHDGVAISSMVAIGAALVNASDWVINKIIALLEAMDQGRYLDTGSILTEIKNAAFGTISLSASIIEDIVAKVRSGLIEPALTALRLGLQDIIKAFSPNIELPSLTSTSAQYVVNVWGSKDILANLGIGGYRETISGKPAINIRIEGADHYDYMKGIKPERLTDQKAKDWNDKVADFVARLVIASQSGPELTAFLNRQIDAGIVSFDGNIYQVNLPRQP